MELSDTPKRGNNGPIPGENFTSDTRNYPWHRPPEITGVDEAIEYLGNKILTKKKVRNGLIVMMDMGTPIASITETMILQGVMNGKWTMDIGLLIAGPIARLLEMMAKDSKIEYDMGIDEDESVPSKYFFEKGSSSSKASPKPGKLEKQALEDIKSNPPTGGLGAPMEEELPVDMEN